MTVGTVEFKDGKLITYEEVKGAAGGVTAVRATNEILPGAKLRVSTEHLANGEWKPGREVTYEEAPEAKLVFK
jgi:hypothetical protein